MPPLVDPSEELRTPGRRAAAAAVFAVFVAAVFGTPLLDAAYPAPAPRALGAEGDRERVRRDAARWHDGTLSAAVERELRDTSRVRRWVMPRYLAGTYRIFDEATGSAHVGRDGWFFLKERADLLHRPTSVALDPLTCLGAAVERRFAARGMRVVAVPVPRKSEVYPERLPPNVRPRLDIYRELVAALEAAGLSPVDLRAAFDAVRDRPLYFQFDSHWNDDGQVVAAEAIATRLGLRAPAEERDTALRASEREDPGDVLRMLGMRFDEEPTDWAPRATARRLQTVRRDGSVVKSSQEPGAPGPVLAISGSSFTANSGFGRFIRHATNLPVETFAWPAIGAAEPLRRLAAAVDGRGRRPDVVLFELQAHGVFCTEGYLPPLGGVFAALRPTATTPLEGPSGADPQGALRPGRLALGRAPTVAAWPPGAFVFRTRGAAAVRLRGAVASGGPVEIAVGAGTPGHLVAEWPAGARALTLPVVGIGDVTAPVVSLVAPRGAVATLDALELVVEASAEPARPGAAEPARTTDASYAQEIRFAAHPGASPRDVLVLRLRDEAAAPVARDARRATLELREDASAAPVVVELAGFARDATAVVELAGLSAGRLRTAVLRGDRSAGDMRVVDARLLTFVREEAAATESRPATGEAEPDER